MPWQYLALMSKFTHVVWCGHTVHAMWYVWACPLVVGVSIMSLLLFQPMCMAAMGAFVHYYDNSTGSSDSHA